MYFLSKIKNGKDREKNLKVVKREILYKMIIILILYILIVIMGVKRD